jgi:hypothetical protein
MILLLGEQRPSSPGFCGGEVPSLLNFMKVSGSSALFLLITIAVFVVFGAFLKDSRP